MRPGVNGVAAKTRQNFGKLVELVDKRPIARYIVLRNAAKPHRAPLVMVTIKPQFAYILKGFIFLDHLVVEVTMIVDYG